MLKNILKGIVIGIANVLPGVSGGTLAVVLGIYDKLTEAIGDFLLAPMKKKIEYAKFIGQIGIGAGIGILLFAKLVGFLYSTYPKITTVGFVVLIIPSIPLILKGENLFSKKNFISFITGILFTVLFIFLTYTFKSDVVSAPGEIVVTFSYGIKLFFCGIVAAGAMIIPGISGSLLLLILGEYYNILSFISSFNIIPLIFFGLGTGIGLIGFAKVINILLHRRRSETLSFIVGIIVVSVFDILFRVFQ